MPSVLPVELNLLIFVLPGCIELSYDSANENSIPINTLHSPLAWAVCVFFRFSLDSLLLSFVDSQRC